MRRRVVLATAAVAIIPLVVMTSINYNQYTTTLDREAVEGIKRLLSFKRHSLEFFLAERRSALRYAIRDRPFEELCDAKVLSYTMRNLNDAFGEAEFVDLGIINSTGRQLCYTGPHDLQGLNYAAQEWFDHVSRTGMFISDVFLGFRLTPHFAAATRHAWRADDFYILRATVHADTLTRQVLPAGLRPQNDIFLANREGVLQTPSRRYGEVLEPMPFEVPRFTPDVTVESRRDDRGPFYLGYAFLSDSPFVLMFIQPKPSVMGGGWPTELAVFLAISVALIMAVILWSVREFVNGIRSADVRRAALMHEVEYSNKLASIGRLAAGVAHEINNPLAIINEKAGLLKDLVIHSEDFQRKDKFLSVADSIIGSVDRCKRITHRLLGFAKHMDVQNEEIDVPALIKEVIGFLEKETEYRNIRVLLNADPSAPSIESDRGQLQQVFLNLVNNAVAAVRDGGRIEISVGVEGRAVTVMIADNGVGISKDNLKRIFEPFFTTKAGSGTGLGLSITYGIVQKLGGQLSVESDLGVGTRFTVRLPIQRGG